MGKKFITAAFAALALGGLASSPVSANYSNGPSEAGVVEQQFLLPQVTHLHHFPQQRNEQAQDPEQQPGRTSQAGRCQAHGSGAVREHLLGGQLLASKVEACALGELTLA